MTTDRELKRTLRALRKLKRDTQIHTEERRQINKQIRDVKDKMGVAVEPDADKQKVIDEITDIKKRRGEVLYVDLNSYSIGELQNHLSHLKAPTRRLQ